MLCSPSSWLCSMSSLQAEVSCCSKLLTKASVLQASLLDSSGSSVAGQRGRRILLNGPDHKRVSLCRTRHHSCWKERSKS